jgi:hypothetical protein
MKAKLLTIILVTIILYSNGQVIESIGFKGGISISNQTYEFKRLGFTETYDYKVGVYSVFTAELFKGRFLSLLTDLGFVQKGMQQKIEVTTSEFPEGTGEYKIWKTTLGYISFSPSLKGFYNFKSLSTYALIGPRIDYRVICDSHVYSQVFSDSNELIFGLTYGVGAEYKIKKFGIIFEFLGHPDFNAILDQKASEDNLGLKITGNSYIITAGLKYHMH